MADSGGVDRAAVLAFGNWANTQENNGRITEYRHRRPGFLGLGRIIRRRINEFRPDLIHVLTLFPEGAWVSLMGRPYVVSLYGTEAGTRGGSAPTRYLKARTLRKASLLLPISRATSARVERYFKAPAPPRIVNPGLPQEPGQAVGEDIRIKLGISPDDILILTLTRLVERKGVAHLIQALAGLPDNYRLIIVGEGPDRGRLETMIRELGLSGRAVLTGFVDDVEPYYRAADLFALASYEDQASGDVEGFGIVLLEAQARGLPVIGTDSGGIPEAFENHGSGLLVPPRDPEFLGQAIQMLGKDPDLRARMGLRGRALVREKFCWADLAGEVVRAYQEALGGRGG